MTFSRNLILGAVTALALCVIIGYSAYQSFESTNVSISPTPEPSIITNQDLSTPESSAVSVSSEKPIVIASPKPTPKPTQVSTPTPTPTPTLKPLRDYYLKSQNQYYDPDNRAGVTEFVENQSYPQMKFTTEFAVNNAIAGDTVEMKIYENGSLQQTKTQQVFSTTNFHFADTYYAKTRSVGTHTIKIVYNENRGVVESNYSNNEAIFTFKILPESIPPTFTIDGPTTINGQTCMRWINLEDNMSVYTDVWGKWKIDDGAWSNRTSENPYGCITAAVGTNHTYTVHAEDFRGNVKEETKVFTVY